MFGMKSGKNNPMNFEYELEKEFKNEEKQKQKLKEIEQKIFDLKSKLRQGINPEDFESVGALINGYASFLKIASNIKK
jgi:hypothetical protein